MLFYKINKIYLVELWFIMFDKYKFIDLYLRFISFGQDYADGYAFGYSYGYA